MAGLMKDMLADEMLTEMSWIMSAIEAICDKIGLETYEITLIKYRVQPEEEQAISKFIAFHARELDSLSIDDIREIVSRFFFETTQKQWSVSDDVLEKLVSLRRTELGL